ncbi:hypothetical protein [uncultured Tateyamaria sp.]|uniref:hypothetical protein n=1 Tax=uncultured Tateyamaria sp. TaxID=455651 RepID=UPI00263253E9|nr:hypothetical protein [uncultured Tateyamaria sp.]
MDSIKVLRGSENLRLCWLLGSQAIALSLLFGSDAVAETCLAPQRPFVPSDPQAAREYADVIRSDFEFYIRDVQGYFRCLEDERARAFEEAREVSEEFGRFLETVGP